MIFQVINYNLMAKNGWGGIASLLGSTSAKELEREAGFDLVTLEYNIGDPKLSYFRKKGISMSQKELMALAKKKEAKNG